MKLTSKERSSPRVINEILSNRKSTLVLDDDSSCNSNSDSGFYHPRKRLPNRVYPIPARFNIHTLLPGYTFIKALFLTHVPIKTSSENLDTIERVVLSIGMSLALVPIVGLLLNYTPWGIRLAPVTLSLLGLSVTFATVAMIREQSEDARSAK